MPESNAQLTPSPSTHPHPGLARGATQNLLGITIAMTANAVIPFALNVQKWVHEHNEGPDGKPKTHFTRIPLWWLGLFGDPRHGVNLCDFDGFLNRVRESKLNVASLKF